MARQDGGKTSRKSGKKKKVKLPDKQLKKKRKMAILVFSVFMLAYILFIIFLVTSLSKRGRYDRGRFGRHNINRGLQNSRAEDIRQYYRQQQTMRTQFDPLDGDIKIVSNHDMILKMRSTEGEGWRRAPKTELVGCDETGFISKDSLPDALLNCMEIDECFAVDYRIKTQAYGPSDAEAFYCTDETKTEFKHSSRIEHTHYFIVDDSDSADLLDKLFEPGSRVSTNKRNEIITEGSASSAYMNRNKNGHLWQKLNGKKLVGCSSRRNFVRIFTEQDSRVLLKECELDRKCFGVNVDYSRATFCDNPAAQDFEQKVGSVYYYLV